MVFRTISRSDNRALVLSLVEEGVEAEKERDESETRGGILIPFAYTLLDAGEYLISRLRRIYVSACGIRCTCVSRKRVVFGRRTVK